MTGSSGTSRIKALDGVRGVAVLAVLLFHLGGGAQSTIFLVRLLGTINKFGWTGVTLFFVLSGFLITGILWDSKGSAHWWRNFFLRRTLRIFPLYYASLLLVVLAAALWGDLHQCLSTIWVYALYLQNMPVKPFFYLASPLTLYHFWSLAVEEQFYLFWPLLLFCMPTKRSARWLCIAIFAACCLFRIATALWETHPMRWVDSLPAHCGALAIGGWLALSAGEPHWSAILRSARIALYLCLIGMLATFWHVHATDPLHPLVQVVALPLLMIFCGCLLVLAIDEGPLRRFFELSPLRWLGGISYGAYVLHVLLIRQYQWLAERLFGAFGRSAVLAGVFLIGFTMTLALAWLSNRYFETPFLRLKQHFEPPRGAHVVPPAVEAEL